MPAGSLLRGRPATEPTDERCLLKPQVANSRLILGFTGKVVITDGFESDGGGVRRFLYLRLFKFPFGIDWYPSVEDAKAECRIQFRIKDRHWRELDDEPVTVAAHQAVEKRL